MARFNLTSRTRNRTKNLAGGDAYRTSARLELVSLLATSFASGQFYRSQRDSLARLAMFAQIDAIAL